MPRCARSSPRCAATAMRRWLEFTQRFDGFDLAKAGLRVSEAEIAGAVAACDAGGAGGAEAGARAHREPPSPPAAARRALHRRPRRGAGLALDGGGVGRALRAGRPRQLPELGPDERRAGEGGGRAARGDGRAVAARRAEPAGAGRGASGGRVGNLPHRRRAGGRGARLRHREHQAGGQDRRARQRLCRGGQAAGVRHGGHRFHRRALRGAGDRRQGATTRSGSPPICWPRPSTTPPRRPSS